MSRLGRNPFEKKAQPQKPGRAAEIVREMNEEAERATAREAAIRTAAANRAQARPTVSTAQDSPLVRLARFVMVDLRAESYVFGIKAYCLSISLLDRA